ncbi:MAG: hypothetical protein ABJO05_16820 [Roseibium sp.]
MPKPFSPLSILRFYFISGFADLAIWPELSYHLFKWKNAGGKQAMENNHTTPTAPIAERVMCAEPVTFHWKSHDGLTLHGVD